MITAEELRHHLSYDAQTGVFRWVALTGSRCNVRIGDVAGFQHNEGYWAIRLKGRIYLAHRLAWLYAYGVWPKNQIDHIDRDRLNNRISNLRDVTNAVNGQNLRGARSHNSTGVLGVWPSRNGKRFKAQIRVDGVKRHLGTFDTAQEAHDAYLIAKRDLHPAYVTARPTVIA